MNITKQLLIGVLFTLLFSCSKAKQGPAPQITTSQPALKTPPPKQPEIWRIRGIGGSSELAMKDARANMRRDVFSRVNRWGENMYADAVDLFSIRDKSGLADYLSLASDTIVRDIPAKVESFEMNSSWTAMLNVNMDELQSMFNSYASRGARYVQESDRKKYKAWCLGRRN